MNTARPSLSESRTSKIGIGVMLLGAVFALAGLVTTTSSHFSNQSCPSGSVLIAKFNFDHSYKFEKPAGNEHVVTLTNASASGATWTSTLAVSGVIVKGGPAAVYTSITPSQFSGTFSNAGLPKVGNNKNTPDVSNVQFCGPSAVAPTSTSSTSTSTSHPSSTTTTHPSPSSTTTTFSVNPTSTTTPTSSTTTYTTTTTHPTSSSTSTTGSTTTTSTSTSTSTSTTSTTSTTATTTSTTVPVSSTTYVPGPTTTLPRSTTTEKVAASTVVVTTTTKPVNGSGTTVPVVTSTTVIPNTGSTLPFTGGQSTPLLILGILFLAGGAALTFSSARRGRGARA